MLPIMERNNTYRLNVQELSGGLNLRDGANIRDNQLSECMNVYFDDGALKTRPAFIANDANLLATPYDNTEFKVRVDINPANTTVIHGLTYILEVITLYRDENATKFSGEEKVIIRYKHEVNAFNTVGEISLGFADSYGLTCLTIQHNGDIYCYLRYFAYPNYEWQNEIYKIARTGEGLYATPVKIDINTAYAPLVLTNGLPVSIDGTKVPRGTQVEGYNLLTRYYRMLFSSYDSSSSETRTKMEFPLMVNINDAGFAGSTIKAVYTTKGGYVCTHIATVKYDSSKGTYRAVESGWNDDDGCFISVDGNILVFNSMAESDINIEYKENYIQNNVEITAPAFTSSEADANISKITSMTKAVWYGNTSLGLHSGSRLFLSGNPNEKALVVWSDFENPLYFSENNYAYVGDKAQAVTAFGRQGSSLIIFKEREIYSTQYTQGEVSAEELTNQAAIDITTRLAQFPMTLIHPYIGCKCPETVQLCRNRLVWVDEHTVYTLTAQNQYSERNVYPVSDMIAPELLKMDMKNAFSADWNGKYLLFVNGAIYVMDYNSYGYVNVASYTKSEDANLLIPWFRWDMPYTNILQVAAVNNEILMLLREENPDVGIITPATLKETDYDIVTASFTIDGYGFPVIDVVEIPIKTSFTTKHFDFNAPDYYKAVPTVFIDAECINDIKVQVLTEHNTDDIGTITKESKQIIPYMRIARDFAFKISCDGAIRVNSMIIKYRTAGVVR